MSPFAKGLLKQELPDNKIELKEMDKEMEKNVADSTKNEQIPIVEEITVIQPDIEELKDYQRRVENFAKEDSRFVFPNSNSYHAAIVMSKIVEHADKTVRIYDDSLQGDLSGKFDVFGQFLPILLEHVRKPNSVLEIVVRDTGDNGSKIYSLLRDLAVKNTRIVVKAASLEFQNKAKSSFNNKDYNFAVNDKKAFRLEEYVKGIEIRKAICSFNNNDYTDVINSIFDSEEFKKCKSIF